MINSQRHKPNPVSPEPAKRRVEVKPTNIVQYIDPAETRAQKQITRAMTAKKV